ncbi:unnamed protein product [Orchesella dallaii]|uniref:Uncharacterized protein n=1 Tax=Orchesella dallaii TaxID=48710 RepID=A0ABP1QFR8_9HEXA
MIKSNSFVTAETALPKKGRSPDAPPINSNCIICEEQIQIVQVPALNYQQQPKGSVEQCQCITAADDKKFFGKKLHECCGITSFRNWNEVARAASETKNVYPSSCCDKTTYGNRCKSPPTMMEVYSKGCLKHEVNTFMLIGYLSFLFSSAHLHFEFFSLVSIVKVYGRQKFVFDHTECCRLQESKMNDVKQPSASQLHSKNQDAENDLNANVLQNESIVSIELKRAMTV